MANPTQAQVERDLAAVSEFTGRYPEYARTDIENAAERLAAEVRRLREVLAKRASAWQPIATAPKDGHCVMLSSGGHPFIGFFHATAGWVTQFVEKCRPPTHWQPLPPAPETEAAK